MTPEKHKALTSIKNRKMVELEKGFQQMFTFDEVAFLIDHFPIGICLTDEYGHYAELNTAYLDLYGYEYDELYGKHFTMIVPEEDRERLSSYHDDFVHHPFDLRDEWNVQRKDGKRIKVLANAALISLEGKPYKLTFVLYFSNLKNTESKLNVAIDRLSERMKGMKDAQRMAYNDMRSSISNIIDISHLLRDEKITENVQQEYLEVISALGYRSLSYLDMSVTLRRIETGEYQLEPRKFQLNQLFANLVRDFAHMTRPAGVPLRARLEGEAPEQAPIVIAYGEIDLYYFMISNLIKNAINASPKGEAVQLRASRQEDTLQIEIENKGAIPPEMRHGLFEKSTVEGKRKGKNLGGYLARLIAELHDGSIDFITSSEYNLTEVFIRLPLPKQDAQETHNGMDV